MMDADYSLRFWDRNGVWWDTPPGLGVWVGVFDGEKLAPVYIRCRDQVGFWR